MEYGQDSFRPCCEYSIIPRVTEKACCVCPNTHKMDEVCQKPEFTGKTCFDTDSEIWQLPIQLENVTEPENIQTQVDPIFRTLKITGKLQYPSGRQVVFERLFPLPENIDINQLKSVFKTQHGQGILLLKAPYLIKNQSEEEGCFTIPCIRLNADKQVTLPKWNKEAVYEEKKKSMLSLPEYLCLLKTVTLAHGKKSHVECMKDTATGAWKLHIQLDTFGYEPENLQVLFHGKGRRLSVIGKRQLTGFGNNVFHSEFLVPEYLDVDQLQWRVMNNGLLRIELPCRGGVSMERKFVRNIPTCTDC